MRIMLVVLRVFKEQLRYETFHHATSRTDWIINLVLNFAKF
jgi:hypothetical protein